MPGERRRNGDHPGVLFIVEGVAERVVDVEEEEGPRQTTVFADARVQNLAARLREGVEDEEEVDAVPFPCSDGVESGHGDGGAG
jgi:hypothetical protein